jgi:hypothetical protein
MLTVGDFVVVCIPGNQPFAGTLISLDPNGEAMIGFLRVMHGTTPLEWGTRSPVAVTGTAGNRGAKAPLAAVVYGEVAAPVQHVVRVPAPSETREPEGT